MNSLALDQMPAISDRHGWFIEAMPDREPLPGEVGWSNILDSDRLDQLLAADAADPPA